MKPKGLRIKVIRFITNIIKSCIAIYVFGWSNVNFITIFASKTKFIAPIF